METNTHKNIIKYRVANYSTYVVLCSCASLLYLCLPKSKTDGFVENFAFLILWGTALLVAQAITKRISERLELAVEESTETLHRNATTHFEASSTTWEEISPLRDIEHSPGLWAHKVIMSFLPFVAAISSWIKYGDVTPRTFLGWFLLSSVVLFSTAIIAIWNPKLLKFLPPLPRFNFHLPTKSVEMKHVWIHPDIAWQDVESCVINTAAHVIGWRNPECQIEFKNAVGETLAKTNLWLATSQEREEFIQSLRNKFAGL